MNHAKNRVLAARGIRTRRERGWAARAVGLEHAPVGRVDDEQLPVTPSTFAPLAPARRKRDGEKVVAPAPLVAAAGAQRRAAGGREAVFQRPTSTVDDPEFQRF